ncbi:Uncharacterised protein [Rothia dentocariosa]|uniref:Uncharacterized protein n=1 Tax=Rothia dentocariosa TaxID=2047 RepID=A0A448UW35_9MICC|nr:Uncharacterised protein [Rothia dentocariosa]
MLGNPETIESKTLSRLRRLNRLAHGLRVRIIGARGHKIEDRERDRHDGSFQNEKSTLLGYAPCIHGYRHVRGKRQQLRYQPDRLVGMSINPDIVGRVYPPRAPTPLAARRSGNLPAPYTPKTLCIMTLRRHAPQGTQT